MKEAWSPPPPPLRRLPVSPPHLCLTLRYPGSVQTYCVSCATPHSPAWHLCTGHFYPWKALPPLISLIEFYPPSQGPPASPAHFSWLCPHQQSPPLPCCSLCLDNHGRLDRYLYLCSRNQVLNKGPGWVQLNEVAVGGPVEAELTEEPLRTPG